MPESSHQFLFLFVLLQLIAKIMVQEPDDILKANCLIFPGVGAFATAMNVLRKRGMTEALCDYIKNDRPFLGICLGLQLLFESSDEHGPGPKGEKYAWYQCTVNGGREGRAIGAYELAKAVQELVAGEILLNCIDCDGQGKGFDIDLVTLIADAVNIPVIASSGAGAAEHFSEVFKKTNASAALAAGMFHRKEVPIQSVKEYLLKEGIKVRI